MKKAVFRVLIIILAGINGMAQADTFLSREMCKVEFETLKKYSGQASTEMFDHEKKSLISEIAEAKNLDCLRRYRFDHHGQSQQKRMKHVSDRCPALPNKYYADRAGRKIYRLTDAQWRRLEMRMLDDAELESCLSPFVEF